VSRRLPLLVALGLVIVMAGWYAALWSPQHSALKAARAKNTAALATQAQLSSELGQLRALQRGLPADAAALERSLPALPTAVSIDTVIDQINAVAVSTGVAWTNESQSVTSAAPGSTTTTPAATTGSAGTAATGVSTVGLTLTVSGPYQAVATFISSLELLPRLIVIDTLSYSPSSSTVSADITGRAFYDPAAVPAIPATAALTSAGG
jgi:Tfp pilus assembly protein PilO